ncbi:MULTISPECIES: helix-turn-helix domain-containing protein [Caldanaerobacter]|uniref:helix-turn-helix domain-containing protein n=1 Tax=Caldanaerobacter TaxID=249529 RepID=UPI0002FD2A0E|nr:MULTISPECIES: helix-turn-helix domain-containing protein [Caldanaerobacter]
MNPIKEAAEALGVSRDVIYCMVYRGVLPHNRTQGKGKKGKILIPKKVSFLFKTRMIKCF